MKIIIAPDKFKGSLTSFEVCNSITDGIIKANNQIRVFEYPMADGGDGFASVMKHYKSTTTVYCLAKDPLLRDIKTSYQYNENTKTAIIEIASASGLMLLDKNEQNPLYTSTYGTGMMLLHAIQRGAKKIILGLGGSATNDAGMGILAAMGYTFLNSDGHFIIPTGNHLTAVVSIIEPSINYFNQVEIEIACDVTNTLFGSNGAAYVFGMQKGGNNEALHHLDNGLRHIAQLLQYITGKKVANVQGTGAAGGIAVALLNFAKATMHSGSKLVIEASGINKNLIDAQLIITGEGKLDSQTSAGKVVSEIAAIGLQNKIPVIAFCGMLNATNQQIKALNLKKIISLVGNGIEQSTAIKEASALLTSKAFELIKTNSFL